MTGAAHSPTTVVEVFADIWCPYAHVGLRRFVQQRWSLGRSDLALRVRAWPLELINGAPLDPHHVGGQVEDLRVQVTPSLFSGFDPERFPSTTLPALDLVSDAYSVGLAVGERASLVIRDALFEHGQDISDPAVLRRLRGQLALPPPSTAARDRVLADWAEGRRRGVVGSPHFFIGDDGFFCPSLQISGEHGDRRIRLEPARFDELFDRSSAA